MDVEDMSKSSGDGPPLPPLPLFKSLREASDVLIAARDDGELPASMELDEFFQRIERLLQRIEGGDDLASAATATDTYVVSVEGLDGCGKSTLVQGLEAAIEGAAVFRTPPSTISSLRPLFDDGNTRERTSRAFYAVTNYLAVEEIQSLGPRLAILDRFYHSTCAYTVSCLSLTDLYRADLAVFEWPHDLPRPNLALQLQMSEEKRKERLATRQDGHGKWERLLEADPTFAKRVKTAFSRQSRNNGNFCKLTPVDAKGAVGDVLEEAKHALAKAGFSV